MASKLRDDEIKWVLNLDAKGIQGELQKITSEILLIIWLFFS